MIKNIKEYENYITITDYLLSSIKIAEYGKKVRLDIGLQSEVSKAISYQWQIGEQLSSGGLSWSNIGDNKNFFEFVAQPDNIVNKYYRVVYSNGCYEGTSNVAETEKITSPLPPTNLFFEGNDSIDELLPVGTIVGEFSTQSTDIYSHDHTYEIVGGTAGFENFEIEGNKLKIKKRIFFKDSQNIILSINSTNDYGLYINDEFTIGIKNTGAMDTNNLIKNADFETENYGFSSRNKKKNNLSSIQDWHIEGFVDIYSALFNDFDWLNQSPLGSYPYNKEDLFLQILNMPKIVNTKQRSENRIYQHLILQGETGYYLSFDLGINANISDVIKGDGLRIVVENDLREKILDTSVYYTDFNKATKVGLNFTTNQSTDYTISFSPLGCSRQTGPLIGKLNLIEEQRYQESIIPSNLPPS